MDTEHSRGPRGSISETDVVVVGAGISGLAVADALVRSGTGVVVLEARPRTGGRLLGSPHDLGASWFWDGEDRVRGLVDRFGLSTFPQHLAGDTVVEDERGVTRHRGNLVDRPAHRHLRGSASLSDALAAALPAGTVLLEHPVDAVDLRSPTGHGDHAMAVTARGRTWHAHHVVLAAPPALVADAVRLPDAVPVELRAAAAATPVWMGQVVKVVAVYDSAFWRRDGLAGAGLSRRGPLQEIHDVSGPDGSPAVLFGFAPSAALLGPDPGQAVRDQLGRLFGEPARRPRELVVHDWGTERWTTPPPERAASAGPDLGSYQFYGHAVYQQPTLAGRLHWTATETSPTFPGHVEGALEAAERAVAAIHHENSAT